MSTTNPVPYLFAGKTANERRSFGFDFSNAQEFQSGNGNTPQTISSYLVVCDNNDGTLTVEAPVLSGSEQNPLIVSAYINGGTVGMTYHIRYRAVTNQNAIIERTVLLPVAVL